MPSLLKKSHYRLSPSLRFSPYAWAKFLYLRDRGQTEIGGFGISAAGDPLLIEDVRLVQQRCSSVTVFFDDEAVADMFDCLVDEGLPPERFARLWLHTHPGDCPLPSLTDEATFQRAFGRTDWAVMAIVAQNDATYARLAFHVGPQGALELPVTVDFSQPFPATDQAAWEAEYGACVKVLTNARPRTSGRKAAADTEVTRARDPEPIIDDDLWRPWDDEFQRATF